MMSDAGLKYLKVILPLKLDWEPCYSYAPADGAAVPEVGSWLTVWFAGRRYTVSFKPPKLTTIYTV